ncbi:MAG: hypothetical protein WCP16_11925 [Pseudanabaena sp. ELA645]|jgi:hypothetical protein
MPINIYRDDSPQQDTIALICDDDWDLASQVHVLTLWLEENGKKLLVGSYIVDIGFRWRRDAGGGGAALSPKAMKMMSDLGMYLFLSEYSGFSDSEP